MKKKGQNIIRVEPCTEESQQGGGVNKGSVHVKHTYTAPKHSVMNTEPLGREVSYSQTTNRHRVTMKLKLFSLFVITTVISTVKQTFMI